MSTEKSYSSGGGGRGENLGQDRVARDRVPESPCDMLRDWLSRTWSTPFGRFYQSLSKSTVAAGRGIGTIQTTSNSVERSSLFPMPLPFRDVLEEASETSAKTFEARKARKRICAQQLGNLLVAMLSFVEMGCPRGFAPVQFPSGELSAEQEAIARRLHVHAEEFCAASGGPIPSTGRGRARLQEMILATGCRYNEGGRKAKACSTVTIAQQVIPEQVSLPRHAGHLRGVDVMCPERASVFRDLSCLELDRTDLPSTRVRSCHKMSSEDELRFIKMMLQKEMCVLIEEECVARHPVSGNLLKGGFFGVPHKPGKMRLIYDRRVANSLERDLSPLWLSLPHGSQFCSMSLEPHQGVRGSTDDLECWFYQIKHEREHWRKQAVGRRWSGA